MRTDTLRTRLGPAGMIACSVLLLCPLVAQAETWPTEPEPVAPAATHPDQATLEAAFEQAATDYGVPAVILRAVAFVESRWIHTGPTIDHGYGIMHLVDNDGDRKSVV